MFKKRVVVLLASILVALSLIVVVSAFADEGLPLLVGGIVFPELPGVNPWTRDDVSPVDQKVDIVHIQWCASCIGQPAADRPSCDADQSGGIITILDVLTVAAYWQQEWDPAIWFNTDGLMKLERGFDIDDLRWLAEQLMLLGGQRNLRGDVGKLNEQDEMVIGHDHQVDLVDLIVMLEALPMRRIGFRDLDLPESVMLQLEEHMAK